MDAPSFFSEVTSPLGVLTPCGTGKGLTGLFMQDHLHGPPDAVRGRWQRDDERFAEVRRQLGQYFAGQRRAFDLPVDHAGIGGTTFQRRVWAALSEIAYGGTVSYGELARRIGQPAAVRAVGLANGRNPLSIIVPCHRVIGAGGTLTGYSGGIERKRALLELEGGLLRLQFPAPG